MHYEITIAKAKRGCHFCPAVIVKKEMHVRQIFYRPRADFPTTKNICFKCAPKFYDTDVINFWKDLIKQAEKLKDMCTPIVKQNTKKNTYQCERCLENEVVWNEVWQTYKCGKCGQDYARYDLDRMKVVT